MYYRGGTTLVETEINEELSSPPIINPEHFATTNFSKEQYASWTWKFRFTLGLLFLQNFIVLIWPVSVTVIFLLDGWISWWWFSVVFSMLLLCLALFNSQPYQGFLSNTKPRFWRLPALYKQIPPLHIWVLYTWFISIGGILWAIGISVAIPWLNGPLWMRILNAVISFVAGFTLFLQTSFLYSWGLTHPYREFATIKQS